MEKGDVLVKMSLALKKLSAGPVHHLEAEDAHWRKCTLHRSYWQASASSITEWKQPGIMCFCHEWLIGSGIWQPFTWFPLVKEMSGLPQSTVIMAHYTHSWICSSIAHRPLLEEEGLVELTPAPITAARLLRSLAELITPSSIIHSRSSHSSS